MAQRSHSDRTWALLVRRRSSRTGPSLLAEGAESPRVSGAEESVEGGLMWITDDGQVALGSAEPVEVTPASRVRHVPKRPEAKQRKTGGAASPLEQSAVSGGGRGTSI